MYSKWREPHFLSELNHACNIEERRHKKEKMNKREKQSKGK
jgi:hypothetical protein